ncbi:MAG: hypothetical protein PHP62_05940 [Candidatus Moranbacteria bacterium]|nr:hypothetical protein [Candidatus Moranbacteria bacterium]
MLIVEAHDSHKDERRTLTAWEEDIQVVEVKHMIVTQDGVRLGGHKHPFREKFVIARGDAMVETWSEKEGTKKQHLSAPQMAIFEPDEEHALTCSKGTIIIVFLLGKFSQQNIIPATNL